MSKPVSKKIIPEDSEKSIQEQILDATDAFISKGDPASLNSLLAKIKNTEEDNEDTLGLSLTMLSAKGHTDFAKKLSNKIDISKLALSKHFEILWGVANNRLAGGEGSPTFLIFQHLLEKGFNPEAKSATGQTVLGEIAKQFGNHLDTDIALVKAILRKTGIAEDFECKGNAIFTSEIGAICKDVQAELSPNTLVRAASITSPIAQSQSCCTVS